MLLINKVNASFLLKCKFKSKVQTVAQRHDHKTRLLVSMVTRCLGDCNTKQILKILHNDLSLGMQRVQVSFWLRLLRIFLRKPSEDDYHFECKNVSLPCVGGNNAHVHQLQSINTLRCPQKCLP